MKRNSFTSMVDAALRQWDGLKPREVQRNYGFSHTTVWRWRKAREAGEEIEEIREPLLGQLEAFLKQGPRHGSEAADADLGQTEQWLQGLLTPGSLRRIVRTYEGRQMVKSLRGVIADLGWPAERKRAVDALLTEALLDAEPPER